MPRVLAPSVTHRYRLKSSIPDRSRSRGQLCLAKARGLERSCVFQSNRSFVCQLPVCLCLLQHAFLGFGACRLIGQMFKLARLLQLFNHHFHETRPLRAPISPIDNLGVFVPEAIRQPGNVDGVSVGWGRPLSRPYPIFVQCMRQLLAHNRSVWKCWIFQLIEVDRNWCSTGSRRKSIAAPAAGKGSDTQAIGRAGGEARQLDPKRGNQSTSK